MERINLKDSPSVRAVVLAAFPHYRKHVAYTHTFWSRGVNVNSYWDGGSRAEYALVHLATLQCRALPTATHPYYDLAHAGVLNSENQDVAVDHVGNVTLKRLPAGFALVEAGLCAGKPATASVFYSAEALPTQVQTVGVFEDALHSGVPMSDCITVETFNTLPEPPAIDREASAL